MFKDPDTDISTMMAAFLEYPVSTSSELVGQCLEQMRFASAEAAGMFEKFAGASKQHSLEQMQELYTITFDMQPVCYPYVGYQLFGESYKRGAFMAQLNEAYHALGYSAGQELPDHLSVILRFLGRDANSHQEDFCHALINEGLIPALEKMLKVFRLESENPYVWLLSALHLFLVQNHAKELSDA
jgi:nitrate reductase delta subunit